jgi:RNA polymerase sigma factor (TIGR02999 family)
MSPPDPREEHLSVLLAKCAEGDEEAERLVFEIAYHHLKQLARHAFRGESRGLTLQASVLVNEAFLRMPRAGEISWQNRQHFFAVAARAMRRTIVDHARERAALKRPPRSQAMQLNDEAVLTDADPTTILLVDQLLSELASVDQRRARVVELRYFSGMTNHEVALVLDVDERTVKRDWQVAKLWLYDRIASQS